MIVHAAAERAKDREQQRECEMQTQGEGGSISPGGFLVLVLTVLSALEFCDTPLPSYNKSLHCVGARESEFHRIATQKALTKTQT